MKPRPFREHHLLRLLDEYSRSSLPLDLVVRNYFHDNKALGSKDRAEIADWVYGIIRWQGLLDHLTGLPHSLEKRFDLYKTFDPHAYLDNEDIPPHLRVSFPKFLYDLIIDSHGEKAGKNLCLASNTTAPTTVRINSLKTTREEMLKLWEKTYEVSPCQHSKLGIRFHKKINFFGLPEFKKGLFEVQDEGSQLLADLMEVSPGQQVLDYCSGSGGKTLAFAHKMQHQGQIYLHDVRPRALLEAKKRLKRAGIQNAQILDPDSPSHKRLKKKMDWVLVDAPCTGTGTLRRNPDMKWRFAEDTLPSLTGKQRMIFEKALSYVKPGGKIVYATCSILKQENEEQTAHFLKTYPIELVGAPFQTLPKEGEMDGFYGVVYTI